MLPMISLFIYMGLSVKISLHRRQIARQVAHEPISNLESSNVESGSTNITNLETVSLVSRVRNINKPTISILAILVWKIIKKNICQSWCFFQFVSLSIIIESLLWTLVVNNMTPDQIMNDTFGNDLLPSHIPKLIHHFRYLCGLLAQQLWTHNLRLDLSDSSLLEKSSFNPKWLSF